MRDKRRWIEWGKDALIALLTLSAIYLLSMTPLIRDSGLLGLLSPTPPGSGSSSGVVHTGVVLPARLAVYRTGGRFGLQYDEAQMEESFSALGPLLGDALSSAGQPAPLPEDRWRAYLQGPSAYFDFSGDIPLTALCGWLGGAGNCPLSGSARRLVLAAGEDDQVLLCWQDSDTGAFYSCATALSRALHLDSAISGVSENGAYFAFEDPALSQLLDPYTLITEGGTAGRRYSVTAPLSTAAGVQALLDSLSFNTQNHVPGSGGEVYLDGGDRLVVSDSGTVTYRAAQGEKYPVGTPSAPVTALQAADGARALAAQSMGPLCGEARLYLISAQPEGDGWLVRFGYRLNGSAVYLYEEGWAAQFLIQDGFITEFTLHLRCYAADDGNTLLLPIDKAAAMLPDLIQDRRELVVQYQDQGGLSVSPDWVAN